MLAAATYLQEKQKKPSNSGPSGPEPKDSSDLSLILDLVARELARKHTAFYNIGFSEAKAMFKQKLARKWGHAIV